MIAQKNTVPVIAYGILQNVHVIHLKKQYSTLRKKKSTPPNWKKTSKVKTPQESNGTPLKMFCI